MFWYEQISAQEALESNRNPIVGDPGRIQQLAAQLTATGDSLRVQNQRLRAVRSDQFWKGEAATAFDTYKQKLPPLLDKVIERYTRVGSALATYHPRLQESQALAARALRDYLAAKNAQQVAQANVQHQQQLQQQAAQQNRELVWNGPQPQQQLTQAQDGIQAAIREMAQAIEQRNQAAITCAATIGQAIDDDLQNPSALRRALNSVGTWLLDKLEKLAPALRTAGAYLAVTALALIAVPGVNVAAAGAAVGTNVAALVVGWALSASGRDPHPTQRIAGVRPLGTMVTVAGGQTAAPSVARMQQAGQLMNTPAVTVIRVQVPDQRIGSTVTGVLRSPSVQASDLVRNPVTIVLPAMPAGSQVNLDASLTLTRVTLPVRTPVLS